MSEQQPQTCKCLIVVKVRGDISAQREAKETLDLLHLNHTNHAIIIDNRPAFLGMLQRAHNYVTWGEATKETVMLMLKKRGKLTGGKTLTEENVQLLGYKSIDELADAIFTCKAQQWKLGMQPVFKLHPPTKGYKGKTKKSFKAGGEAGYRGEAINELIKRMV
ncbi:MAG: 50S ribosomal protein L30 [Candidatus Bathyarchaeota archaeon]|nr:50S ribosomal protein L30 [Candidatus Bathyarchaeota archaeon]